MTMTERELQDAVLATAELLGWHHRYHTYTSKRSPAGFPDLVLIRGDRIIFAELKSDRGRVTVEQASWIDALEVVAEATDFRMSVVVWRPLDWSTGMIELELR